MTTTKMRLRKDRLKKLADFLENEVKPRWFDLSVIASKGFNNRECGSAACAIGWTPAAFPRSGISLVPTDGGGCVMYKNMCDFGAVQLFYGLSQEQAEWLFEPLHYPARKRGRMDVVRRLRFIVKQGDMPADAKV